MKIKSKCCKKYEKKAAICKRCPLLVELGARERKVFLKKAKKRRKKAA